MVYMHRATVSATAYAVAPDLTIPFMPRSISVVNEDTGIVAFVSFDGREDHGALAPGTSAAGLTYSQSCTRVWLRTESGSPTIQVIAES